MPICVLNIADTLESSQIVYVSPYIIRELKLTMNPNLHNGFQARNTEGEVIIKMVLWKEGYFGGVSEGTEMPKLHGVAVLVRVDYYSRLLAAYSSDGWFIFRKNDSGENN